MSCSSLCFGTWMMKYSKRQKIIILIPCKMYLILAAVSYNDDQDSKESFLDKPYLPEMDTHRLYKSLYLSTFLKFLVSDFHLGNFFQSKFLPSEADVTWKRETSHSYLYMVLLISPGDFISIWFLKSSVVCLVKMSINIYTYWFC